MAAVLATGDGALLGYWSAASLWDLARPSSGQVHVIAPGGSRLNVEGITKHRARNLHEEDRGEQDGIPLTSVARTLLDLAPSMQSRRLARALEDAEKRDLLDANAIRRVCDRNRGHRGTRRQLKQLARLGPLPDARSPFERRFARFCEDRMLPLPAFNVGVGGFEIDALWAPERLIIELDSWKHHRTRDAFERDRARDADLMLTGYRVLRLTWRRLDDEPAATAAIIGHLLAERGRG
jgi:very-short-patch-repair endonuclease